MISCVTKEPLSSSAEVGVNGVDRMNETAVFVHVVFLWRQISAGGLVNHRVCPRAIFLLQHIFHLKLPCDIKNVRVAEYAVCHSELRYFVRSQRLCNFVSYYWFHNGNFRLLNQLLYLRSLAVCERESRVRLSFWASVFACMFYIAFT